MRFRLRERAPVAINIAPLVDVVFLLVIFFAVSTSFLDTAGLKLELPSSTSTAERAPREVTVVLAADGAVSLQGEIVDRAELEQRMREALQDATSKIVVLRADARTAHGDVVAVMDVVRAAGAEGLTVAARAASER